MDFEDLVRRIRQTSAPPGVATKIVAVDGHGGAGKTTLAARLANALGCEVIQTDDFASWDNPVDWWPRLLEEALEPLAKGEPARFRCTNWEGGPERERVVEAADCVVLEGVTASREAFRSFLAF